MVDFADLLPPGSRICSRCFGVYLGPDHRCRTRTDDLTDDTAEEESAPPPHPRARRIYLSSGPTVTIRPSAPVVVHRRTLPPLLGHRTRYLSDGYRVSRPVTIRSRS